MKRSKLQNDNSVPVVPLAQVLQALADPVRLEIVRQLDEEGQKPCGSFGIDRPKSSMSHHFNILRAAKVLSFEKQGVLLMNRVEREYLNAFYPGVLDSVLASARREFQERQDDRTEKVLDQVKKP